MLRPAFALTAGSTGKAKRALKLAASFQISSIVKSGLIIGLGISLVIFLFSAYGLIMCFLPKHYSACVRLTQHSPTAQELTFVNPVDDLQPQKREIGIIVT